ncbi:ABC transporter permease [Vibrio sp. S4M6]|uniref:ABC transporter permease n=1 Tax=Vibrio sinus TaxID=2946865 RepID=UPI002029E922|nr:ABC transporter permease [Vibrio sinus]MCL9781636.1 ABC transporter permease [Vibrio sinus]
MKELISQTLSTLWAYRLKSTLAIIAIAWGVTSVVVLMALGEGFYQKQSAAFAILLNNTQMAISGSASKAWQGLPPRRAITLTKHNVEPLLHSPLVSAISILYENDKTVVTNSKGQSIASSVAGIDPNYLAMSSLQLKPGSRNFTPIDQENHARVAILGWQLAETSHVKVGDAISINHVPFTVIGILNGDNVQVSFGDANRVEIPSATFTDMWDSFPAYIVVKPAGRTSASELRQEIIRYFSHVLHFDPSDDNAIYLPDLSGGAEMIKAVLRGIQLFLAASGAMTLAVGALGVANIMFLSVTERTREVGVRLAVGATKFSILRQFMAEGIALVCLGALVGLGLSWLAVYLLNTLSLPNWLGSPIITLSAVNISSGITFLLAILASWFPARRAAALTPIIALSARA